MLHSETQAPREDEAAPQSSPEPSFELTSVGDALRKQRELLGLSLEEVARHTHLRVHYLQALEDGNFEMLPSTVQGSGMLKNYASFLGLDPEPLLLLFAENLQARLRERQPQRREPTVPEETKKRPSGLGMRFFSREVVFSGAMVIFLVGFVVWGGLQIATTRSQQQPEPTPPSIADVLLPSPTASLVPTATATIPSPIERAADAVTGAASVGTNQDAVVPDEPMGAVYVQVIVHQRAYMRVMVDGEVQFDGRVLPGGAYAFSGDERVEILTGNGAGLQVMFNNQDLGTLGAFGDVVDVIYTLSGLQTPTPTVTPTPTRTPRVTRTPSPTLNP